MTNKNKTAFKSVDTISKDLDIVDSFVLKNWKKYVYIAIGIVVVFAAVLFFYEHRANNNLIQAQEIFTARTAPELQKMIDKYPNSEAVGYSRLKLASMYFQDKKYDKAQALYADEVKNGKSDFLISLAKLNNCYATEVLGNKDKAAAGFEEIADNAKISEAVRAEAAYSSGRILMNLGKKQEALKYLNLCISFDAYKGWSKFAKGIIDDNA